MIEDLFGKIYEKFKIHFYRSVFERIQNRELTLTAVETFCIEVIYALDFAARIAGDGRFFAPGLSYSRGFGCISF